MKRDKTFRMFLFSVSLFSVGTLFSACLGDSEKEPLNADFVTINGVKHVGDFAPVEVGMKWAYACSSYYGQTRDTPHDRSRRDVVYDLEILSVTDSGMTALYRENGRATGSSYWPPPEEKQIFWDSVIANQSQIFIENNAGQLGAWPLPFAPTRYLPVSEVTEVLYENRRHMQWVNPPGLAKYVYLSNIGMKSLVYRSGGGGWSTWNECHLLSHSP